jgi:hypothetical protein
MFAQIAIVAKQGQAYYLAPIFALVCLANGGISYLLLRGGILQRTLGGAVVLGFVAHGLWYGARVTMGPVYAEGTARREDIALQQRLATTACKVVFAYESQTIPYKLFFGDIFAGHSAAQALPRRHILLKKTDNISIRLPAFLMRQRPMHGLGDKIVCIW